MFFLFAGLVESPLSDLILPIHKNGIFTCIADSNSAQISWNIKLPNKLAVPYSGHVKEFNELGFSVDVEGNSSFLHIKGSLENNNTQVYCGLEQDGGIVASEIVSFILYGKLQW